MKLALKIEQKIERGPSPYPGPRANTLTNLSTRVDKIEYSRLGAVRTSGLGSSKGGAQWDYLK